MAQFMGTVQGQRGEASRLGGKSSGLTTTCNGWHGGVTVHANHVTLSKDDERDTFEVWGTRGSSGRGGAVHLLTLDAKGEVAWVNPDLRGVEDGACPKCGSLSPWRCGCTTKEQGL